MAIEFEKVETPLLTREVAAKHAAMDPMPGEREQDPKRMKYLDGLLVKGEFHAPEWATAKIRGTGKLYRGDGMHSSMLLSRCVPELFPAGIVAIIKTYRLDSIEEDGAAFFDLFNNPRSARSPKDKIGVYRAEHPKLEVVPRPFLVKMTNGYDFHLKNLPKRERKFAIWDARNRGKYLAYPQVETFVLWAYEWEQLPDLLQRWIFSKAGVAAAMFESWDADQEEAAEFWGHVLHDDHKQKDHPTRELNRILIGWKRGSAKRSQAMYYQQCMKAWLLENSPRRMKKR